MTEMSGSEIAKVKEVWGDAKGSWRTPQIVHWMQHPKVRERMNLLTSGELHKDRFQYFLETYLRGRTPVQRAVTLGSGHGELERGFSQYNLASLHEGIDIADGAVSEARRLAADAGFSHIRYQVGDLNSVRLPESAYDVVFGVMSIHHVRALEHLFRQVSMALKPEGYFFLDEFIGPSQFQWPEHQLAAINEQVAVMPELFKAMVSDRSMMKTPVARHTIEEMNSSDPSEAIRSAEILQLLPRYFEVVEVRGYGGSLLHLLLEHIAGNFTEEDPGSMNYLRLIFDLEDRLIASGKLAHDFAIIVARRRSPQA